MKKLLGTRVSDNALSFSLLLLRVGFGGLMAVDHGWPKLTGFNRVAEHFPALFGMSPSLALSAAIFAEFFCAAFIVAGLFTRFAAIPLMITMGIAFFKIHNHNFHAGNGGGQLALLFFIAFLVLFITGPGKVSLDRLIAK